MAPSRSSHRFLVAIAVLGAVCVLLSACARGARWSEVSPEDLEGSRTVSFGVGGSEVQGRLFGDGSVGVVLVHGLSVDQRAWFGFAATLAEEGYTALTFDLRGYCPGDEGGCSEGQRSVDAAWQDVQAAADFLREQSVTTVALVGSSMGGTASLVAAADPATDRLASVVTLSAPTAIEGLATSPELLQSISGGKLFVAGVGDAPAADAAQQLYDWSIAPKRVEIVPSDAHGAALLAGNRAEEVRTLILTNLAQYTQEEER